VVLLVDSAVEIFNPVCFPEFFDAKTHSEGGRLF
jgi:hypothetical protein